MFLNTSDNYTYILDIADNHVAPNAFKVKRLMFQDVNDLKEALSHLSNETKCERLKVEKIKVMNHYLRFIRLQEIPTWMILTISDAIRKAKEELTMIDNEMI